MPKKKEKTKTTKKPTNQKRKIDEVDTKPSPKAKKTKESTEKVESSLENLSSSLNSLVESQTNDTVQEDYSSVLNEDYLEETSVIPLIRKLRVRKKINFLIFF